MRFGIGSEVSKHVYMSMDKSLLNYYSACDVILNYLRNVSNIEDMTKEEFCDELELNEDIIKMINEFLERFKYSTPYCWFYFHILTLGDKMNLKYLMKLIFEDDINENEITIDNKTIRLYTVKSGVEYDNLFNIWSNCFKFKKDRSRRGYATCS